MRAGEPMPSVLVERAYRKADFSHGWGNDEHRLKADAVESGVSVSICAPSVAKLLRMKRLALLVWFLLIQSAALSAVKLPAMFADHMVLQRGMEVPVWGTAE